MWSGGLLRCHLQLLSNTLSDEHSSADGTVDENANSSTHLHVIRSPRGIQIPRASANRCLLAESDLGSTLLPQVLIRPRTL